MSEGVGDPRLTAEGEVGLARLALDDDELRHAADHVAGALAADPTLPDAHEVLATLLSRPGGGVELWPLEGDIFIGTVVARAHALAWRGEFAEALGLLASAQGHEPSMRWADVAWVLDPAMPGKCQPSDLVSVFAQLFRAMPEGQNDDLQAAYAPYLALARNMTAAHPGSSWAWWAASVFLRRHGRYDEAVEAAKRSAEVEPSDRAAIALAYALREQGRTDEALAALEQALTFDSGNLSVYADIASLLGRADRLDEAIGWTERALAINPGHDCSQIERYGLRHRRYGRVDELVGIADLLRFAEPGTHEAQHANDELTDPSRQVWLGGVPAPTEAVINVLGQVLEQEVAPTGPMSLAVSAVEPPSALLAFDRVMPGSDVAFNEVLAPDPRQPVAIIGGPAKPVGLTVWTYDGNLARPAVAPPTPEGAEAVARVAQVVWAHLPAAYDGAVLLADTRLDDLLGVLVHPPALQSDDRSDWPMWIRSLQVAACLGIAHHRTDEPWQSSTRRRVLSDLVYGPEDWVTEAAMLALVATAWVDPAARGDVADLVGWRFMSAAEAAKARPVTILESLALLALATPALNTAVADLARDIVNLPAVDPEPAPAPERKKRGLFRRR
ncbi:tetratricopeptide repeat protein [Kribbella sp. NPDC051952]|uniref:tetratricopeptide repeat protein n=1 Tax=Kribbella sp. NPDC051952 TaxID=3154851 RepID=UPI003418F230